MLGHQLCESLLIEARAALIDRDWPYAFDRLLQFKGRIVCHMRAEEELLYPQYLLLMEPEIDVVRKLHGEHETVDSLTQEALDAARIFCPSRCNNALTTLIELIPGHVMEEQRLACSLPRDNQNGLLRKLALALSARSADTTTTPVVLNQPVSHTYH